MRRLLVLCALFGLLLTLGCGNKGPLYLPPADGASPQDAEESEK